MSFSNAEPGKHHYNRLRTPLRPYKNPSPTLLTLWPPHHPVLGEINSHFVLLLSSPICLSQAFHTMESCAIWLARPFWVLYTYWHLSPHSILKSELTSPLVQTLWSNDGSLDDSPDCCPTHTDWHISKWWPQKTEGSEEAHTWLEVTSQLPDSINHRHPKTMDRDRHSDQNTTFRKSKLTKP